MEKAGRSEAASGRGGRAEAEAEAAAAALEEAEAASESASTERAWPFERNHVRASMPQVSDAVIYLRLGTSSPEPNTPTAASSRRRTSDTPTFQWRSNVWYLRELCGCCTQRFSSSVETTSARA